MRRVVRVNAGDSVFPPSVAARFDVVDMRRIWIVGGTLKLLEKCADGAVCTRQ